MASQSVKPLASAPAARRTRRPRRAKPSDLTRPFGALSDQTRTGIVELLADGDYCVCELAEELEIAQPLLSFHLRVLRDSGLVRARRQGRWTYYSLDLDTLEAAGRALTGVVERSRELGELRARCC